MKRIGQSIHTHTRPYIYNVHIPAFPQSFYITSTVTQWNTATLKIVDMKIKLHKPRRISSRTCILKDSNAHLHTDTHAKGSTYTRINTHDQAWIYKRKHKYIVKERTPMPAG